MLVVDIFFVGFEESELFRSGSLFNFELPSVEEAPLTFLEPPPSPVTFHLNILKKTVAGNT